jgi:DNA polymerase-4
MSVAVASAGARPTARGDNPGMQGAKRRWIAHLDMDAFYASVELLRYPELRGLPVVIGGGRRHQPVMLADGTRRFARLRDYAGRGVAPPPPTRRATWACSRHGLDESGAARARRRAAAGRLRRVPALLARFKAAVAEVAPLIEDRGIDEIYIDLTDLPGVQEPWATTPWRRARRGAGDRNSVRARHRADLLDRRDAEQAAVEDRLRAGQARRPDTADAGRAAHAHLAAAGAAHQRHRPEGRRQAGGAGHHHHRRDSRREPRMALVEHFGRGYGRWLHDAAHGRDDRPVVTHSEPVSISRETTFERDLHAKADRAVLAAIFTELCEQLAGDLQRKGYVGRTVGIKLRFDDFRTVTRDQTLAQAIADSAEIRRAAGTCLKRVDLSRRLRLLGVRVGTLARAGQRAARPGDQRAGSEHAAAAPADSPELPFG